MEILDTLKQLINGELAAAIQYKIAAESLVGTGNFAYIQSHCAEHSEEEFDHYQLLVAALMQRGGSADLTIQASVNDALPATEELESADVSYIKSFFARAEDNAIKAYVAFHEEIKDSDPGLDDIILGIIEDEREHKLDFTRVDESRPTLESFKQKQRANKVLREMLAKK